MPLNLDSATRYGDFWCVELENVLAMAPAHVRLTDVGWEASRSTLREHAELAAVIVLQPTDLLAEIFAATWAELPSRLASLAV